MQVGREVARVTLPQLRLHLQALDRFEATDVFGDEGLVACAEQELFIKPALEDRRDQEARDGDDQQDAQRDGRERDAVPEHHAQADHKKRHVESQRNGCAGDELADVLHAMQASRNDTGGAVLEVAHRQLEQVIPHRRAQYGIDAIAAVQHEVLAHPCEQAREDGEDRHRNADGNQRALRSVHDHLVDDRLREERGGERDELQRERREQHVAPNVLVLEQFRHEPPEAESARSACQRIRVRECLRLGTYQPCIAGTYRRKLGVIKRARGVGP